MRPCVMQKGSLTRHGADRDLPPPAYDKQPPQVRIPGPIKRRFKAHAAMMGVAPNQLFVEMWEHFERTRAGASGHQTGA